MEFELIGMKKQLKKAYYQKSLGGSARFIDPKELKAEAVKWVKEIIKNQNNKGNYRSDHMNPRKQGQISWIKLFFNLTEEDLG